jgi:hypothetical protein
MFHVEHSENERQGAKTPRNAKKKKAGMNAETPRRKERCSNGD